VTRQSTHQFHVGFVAAAWLVAVLTACGGDGPTEPTGLPLTGTFSGDAAPGTSRQVGFVAGRSGATIVKVCGRLNTNFDIAIEGTSAASPSNCERVEFAAVAGRSYSLQVDAVSGGGPFNGCWSAALVECTVTVPPPATQSCADPGYYDVTSGKAGAQLLQTLGEIVATNRNLGYLTTPNARDSLYAFVDDPDGDDQIIDLYTGRAAAVVSRASAAAAGFNTEHVWPQSRGANIDFAAGADLNILFTSDSMANRVRSNAPFGVVTHAVQWTGGTGTEVSRLGLNAQGTMVFEPRPSKRGDVARAVFYFHTRYYGVRPPGFSLANFNLEESTLYQWAAADPPDTFELNRNAMVCRAQGNRNPFVDHPEFLVAIGDFPNQ
jgi:endonuclease I